MPGQPCECQSSEGLRNLDTAHDWGGALPLATKVQHTQCHGQGQATRTLCPPEAAESRSVHGARQLSSQGFAKWSENFSAKHTEIV